MKCCCKDHLKRRALLDLYFKVILPSVTYGIIVWGGCNNYDHIQALETLHRRAVRIIFNLSWDTPSDTVMEITKWDSILDLYKLSLIKLFYNIVIEKIPKTISDLVTWRHGPYNLRGHLKAVVPRFSTSFLNTERAYMTEAEVFSLSITNPKERRTGVFDWLTDQTGSQQGALQIYFKHPRKSLLYKPCK